MNIDKLKKKIAEANPYYLGAKGKSECTRCHRNDCVCIEREPDGSWNEKGRTLRLCDVLIALETNFTELPSKFSDVVYWLTNDAFVDGRIVRWNLKENSLDKQDDRCKQFLVDLLVSKARPIRSNS